MFNNTQLRNKVIDLERDLNREKEYRRETDDRLEKTRKTLFRLLKHLGLEEQYVQSHYKLEKIKNESPNIQ